MQSCLVTGADRGLGLAICKQLADQGWQVFAGQFMPDWPELSELAGQYPDRFHVIPLDVQSTESVQAAAKAVQAKTNALEVMINNAGVTSPTMMRPIRETQDYAEIHRLYNTNAVGPLRVVEAFLPLMDQGTMKRLCFVSSEAGSVTRAQRRSWFGYCMSKAALNMGVKILFNDLRPEGYTFRVYHPGWVRSYMSGRKNNEADLEPEEAAAPAVAFFLTQDPAVYDEDQLVLRDYQGKDWPW